MKRYKPLLLVEFNHAVVVAVAVAFNSDVMRKQICANETNLSKLKV